MIHNLMGYFYSTLHYPHIGGVAGAKASASVSMWRKVSMKMNLCVRCDALCIKYTPVTRTNTRTLIHFQRTLIWYQFLAFIWTINILEVWPQNGSDEKMCEVLQFQFFLMCMNNCLGILVELCVWLWVCNLIEYGTDINHSTNQKICN